MLLQDNFLKEENMEEKMFKLIEEESCNYTKISNLLFDFFSKNADELGNINKITNVFGYNFRIKINAERKEILLAIDDNKNISESVFINPSIFRKASKNKKTRYYFSFEVIKALTDNKISESNLNYQKKIFDTIYMRRQLSDIIISSLDISLHPKCEQMMFFEEITFF